MTDPKDPKKNAKSGDNAHAKPSAAELMKMYDEAKAAFIKTMEKHFGNQQDKNKPGK